MNRYGAGTRLYRASLLYAKLAIIYDEIFFSQFYPEIVGLVSATPLGLGLIGLGLVVYHLARLRIYTHVEAGELARSGIYAIVRHPIYAAFVLCFMPGFALLKGTPLCLSVPLFTLWIYRLCIKDEETHLLNLHGASYLEYARRTGGIFPKISIC